MYLLLGIAAVVVAAAVGSAVGDRAGLFAAAGLAAFSWVGAVYVCGLFSRELEAVLPAHIACAVATVAVMALVVRFARKSADLEPQETLQRLQKVKQGVRESQHAKKKMSNSGEDGRAS